MLRLFGSKNSLTGQKIKNCFKSFNGKKKLFFFWFILKSCRLSKIKMIYEYFILLTFININIFFLTVNDEIFFLRIFYFRNFLFLSDPFCILILLNIHIYKLNLKM